MKPIKKFPGYFITKSGSVYSVMPRANQQPPKIPRKIANNKGKRGYVVIHLSRNKKSYKRYLHRLLLETFVREPFEKEQGMHLDGNPLNNSLKNLRWGFHKENQSHRIIHGTDNRGGKHGMSKLTKKEVLKIRKLANSFNLKKRKLDKGGNYKEIGRKFGVSASTIGHIVRRSTWDWL